MASHPEPSLITFVPAEAASPDHTELPDRFRFVLTGRDWNFLCQLSTELGTGIHDLWAYSHVVTCDEHGHEIDVDQENISHYRCDICVSDFGHIIDTVDLRPSFLNEYLGETELIPIIHDLREALTEYRAKQLDQQFNITASNITVIPADQSQ